MTRTSEFHYQIMRPTSRSMACLSQSQQAAGHAQLFRDQQGVFYATRKSDWL
jgi:hypothetical protein